MYELALPVIQDDLNTGEPCDYHNCALAKALKRYFGEGYAIQVGYQYATVWHYDTSMPSVCHLKPMPDAEQLMLNFDDCLATREQLEPTTVHFLIQSRF